MAVITEYHDASLVGSHFINISGALAEKIKLILIEAIGEKNLARINFNKVQGYHKILRTTLPGQKIPYSAAFTGTGQFCIKMTVWTIDHETREICGSLTFPISGDAASVSRLIQKTMDEIGISHPMLSCENFSGMIKFRFILHSLNIKEIKPRGRKGNCDERPPTYYYSLPYEGFPNQLAMFETSF